MELLESRPPAQKRYNSQGRYRNKISLQVSQQPCPSLNPRFVVIVLVVFNRRLAHSISRCSFTFISPHLPPPKSRASRPYLNQRTQGHLIF